MTLWIIAACLVVVGTPFVLAARRTFERDRIIATWPRAPGVITHASVTTSTGRRYEADHRVVEYTAYEPILRYTYSVAGQELHGKEILPSGAFTTGRSEAEQYMARYPVEKQVEVLYDPNRPTTAYLEVKRSTGAVILLVMGSAFYLAAAILVLLALIL
jgi:hypothetical protein